MPGSSDETLLTVREPFLADHQRLEKIFEQVLAAAEADDHEELLRQWTTFESGLLGHMEAEELHLIPHLQRLSPANARILIQEHRHLRSRLAELGVALDLHALRLDTARAFIDELRGHARSEDRLMYRCAEEQLPHEEKVALLRALADGVHRVRPRRAT